MRSLCIHVAVKVEFNEYIWVLQFFSDLLHSLAFLLKLFISTAFVSFRHKHRAEQLSKSISYVQYDIDIQISDMDDDFGETFWF